jgi:hypothetical protein
VRRILLLCIALLFFLVACEDKEKKKPQKVHKPQGQKIKVITKPQQVKKEVEATIQKGMERTKRLSEQQ